jgi:hypothetical protein
MQISWDDGIAILKRFGDESLLLKAVFVSRSGIATASVIGKLWSLHEGNELWITVKGKPEDFISFLLNGCFFEYGDAREAPERLQESANQRYEGLLIVVEPQTGERFYIFEVKL